MQELLDGHYRYDPCAGHRRLSHLDDRIGDGLDVGLFREDLDLGVHAGQVAREKNSGIRRIP